MITRCRTLASVPDEDFEEMISDRREEAMKSATRSVDRALSTNSIIKQIRQNQRADSNATTFSPIIKPSDNWNFSAPVYPRIDESDGHGYIPGDLYANLLWYYTINGDRVLDPMAGGGMIKYVWEDRKTWMVGDSWYIELLMADLNPRGKYKDEIVENDLTQSIPYENIDYIVMDIPYFGMVEGQYSTKLSDIANLSDFKEWCLSLSAIAENCINSQEQGGLCTVISPNYRDLSTKNKVMVTSSVENIFLNAGYGLYDKAYASRRIQQSQTPTMAKLNNLAKKKRVMLTDISEILTFIVE